MQLSREFWHQSVTRRWEDLGNMTAGEVRAQQQDWRLRAAERSMAWAHVIMTCRDARVFGGIKFRVGVAHNKLPNRAQVGHARAVMEYREVPASHPPRPDASVRPRAGHRAHGSCRPSGCLVGEWGDAHKCRAHRLH
eukprot:scaffold91_cov254-Pinguiococcus_pyrenoidosus.AAC.25